MAKNQGQTRGQRAQNAPGGADAAATTARRAPAAKEPRMVRAKERGYADGAIREPGEVFATQAPEGSWMEELKGRKGKDARLQEAVDDTMATKKDDPDLTTFGTEALQAEALRLGLTDATGLSDDDLIAAIRAAYENQAQ